MRWIIGIALACVLSSITHADDMNRKCYVAMFTASYCVPCQHWKREQKPIVKAAGFTVREYEMTDVDIHYRYSQHITKVPTFVICDYETGEWIYEPFIGSVSAETLLVKLKESRTRSTKVKITAKTGTTSRFTFQE